MIEINLLPKHLRGGRKPILPEIPVMPLMISVVILLAMIHAALYGFANKNEAGLKTMNKKWVEIEPGRKAADEVVAGIKDIEDRTAVTMELARLDVDWAELLSGLNRAMIAGVWLAEFKPDLKDKKVSLNLGLSGYVLGKSEVATSTLAQFINSLKQTESFSRYFREIELQNTHQQAFGGEEVMAFRLVCEGKAKEVSAGGKETVQKKGNK